MELETKQQSDDALVARFRRGDVDAFGELYERHRGGLYGYALSICLDAARAADAVQELWLGFLENIETLANVANIKAYLYRSLRNKLIDEYRRRQREKKALAGGSSPVVLIKPRDTVASQEEAQRLNSALQRLPEEQREVVLLRVYAGMKYGDIADVLQASTKTVESRHRLALEKLREWLGADES